MKKSARRTGISLILVILIALPPLLNGCASLNTASEHDNEEIFWPPAPFEARIRWVKSIHNRHDAGIEKGFWRKVVEFVTGKETEGISKPYGIYADAKDRLFVADAGRGVVHEFDIKGKEYSLVGHDTMRVFKAPIAIAGDDEDNLYITDSAAGTVYRYAIGKKKLVQFITRKLVHPTGIAYHASNKLLYITDTANHQVVVFDMQARERFRIGKRGESSGQFNFPTDLFIDQAGDLYVTDALNSRIQVFSSDGRFLRMFGSAGDTTGYFSKPKGVAVDSEGHIYVSDALQDSVQIFDKTGALMLEFGTKGSGAGQFWMPSGLFIDSFDNIYVGDAYNQRIQIFKYLKSKEEKATQKSRNSSGIENEQLSANKQGENRVLP